MAACTVARWQVTSTRKLVNDGSRFKGARRRFLKFHPTARETRLDELILDRRYEFIRDTERNSVWQKMDFEEEVCASSLRDAREIFISQEGAKVHERSSVSVFSLSYVKRGRFDYFWRISFLFDAFGDAMSNGDSRYRGNFFKCYKPPRTFIDRKKPKVW